MVPPLPLAHLLALLAIDVLIVVVSSEALEEVLEESELLCLVTVVRSSERMSFLSEVSSVEEKVRGAKEFGELLVVESEDNDVILACVCGPAMPIGLIPYAF